MNQIGCQKPEQPGIFFSFFPFFSFFFSLFFLLPSHSFPPTLRPSPPTPTPTGSISASNRSSSFVGPTPASDNPDRGSQRAEWHGSVSTPRTKCTAPRCQVPALAWSTPCSRRATLQLATSSPRPRLGHVQERARRDLGAPLGLLSHGQLWRA